MQPKKMYTKYQKKSEESIRNICLLWLILLKSVLTLQSLFGNNVLGNFYDTSKAFRTISHSILIFISTNVMVLI